ncbi:MAG: hypothetical protein ACYCZR_14250 [Burkholderiales bacterium]
MNISDRIQKKIDQHRKREARARELFLKRSEERMRKVREIVQRGLDREARYGSH